MFNQDAFKLSSQQTKEYIINHHLKNSSKLKDLAFQLSFPLEISLQVKQELAKRIQMHGGHTIISIKQDQKASTIIVYHDATLRQKQKIQRHANHHNLSTSHSSASGLTTPALMHGSSSMMMIPQVRRDVSLMSFREPLIKTSQESRKRFNQGSNSKQGAQNIIENDLGMLSEQGWKLISDADLDECIEFFLSSLPEWHQCRRGRLQFQSIQPGLFALTSRSWGQWNKHTQYFSTYKTSSMRAENCQKQQIQPTESQISQKIQDLNEIHPNLELLQPEEILLDKPQDHLCNDIQHVQDNRKNSYEFNGIPKYFNDVPHGASPFMNEAEHDLALRHRDQIQSRFDRQIDLKHDQDEGEENEESCGQDMCQVCREAVLNDSHFISVDHRRKLQETGAFDFFQEIDKEFDELNVENVENVQDYYSLKLQEFQKKTSQLASQSRLQTPQKTFGVSIFNSGGQKQYMESGASIVSFGPSPYAQSSANRPPMQIDQDDSRFKELFSHGQENDQNSQSRQKAYPNSSNQLSSPDSSRSPVIDSQDIHSKPINIKSQSSKNPEDSSLRYSWNNTNNGFNINSKEGRRRALLGMKRTISDRRAHDDDEEESKSRQLDDTGGWYSRRLFEDHHSIGYQNSSSGHYKRDDPSPSMQVEKQNLQTHQQIILLLKLTVHYKMSSSQKKVLLK